MSKTEEKRQKLFEENTLLAQATKEARNKQVEDDRAEKGKKAQIPLSSAARAALDAAIALKAEQKEHAQACLREIQAIAKKYNCSLHATPVIVPRNDGTFVLAANVNITNLPLEEPTE